MENVETNHRVELWHNKKIKNRLMEEVNDPAILKKLWVDILPGAGSSGKRAGIETIVTNVTHRIIVPYSSGKIITTDMWFEYREHKFQIIYILDNFSNDKLEIFVEEVKG